MKKIILAVALLFALTRSYGQTYPLRYSVFIDSVGIQHTSTIPTKKLAITGDLNDALVKFSTLAQSGITDVYTKTESDNNYATQARTLTINGVTYDLSANRSWTISTSGSVSSVYGRTGAVIASNGDYSTSQVTEGSNLYWTTARGDARYPLLTGSYVNPSWITSLDYSKLTNVPVVPPIPSNTLSKSANYTVLSTDFANAKTANLIIRVNCTSGAVTITLPSALNGYSVTVIKTDNSVNLCTVSGLTGDNLVASQYQSRIAVADASTWNNN